MQYYDTNIFFKSNKQLPIHNVLNPNVRKGIKWFDQSLSH